MSGPGRLPGRVLAPLAFAAISCGSTVSSKTDPAGPSAAGGAGGSTGTTGGTTEGAASLPPECADTNPFGSEACGGALKTVCRDQVTQQACEAQGPFSFSDGEYVFMCGWAKIVTFSDPDSCTVGSVSARCEAGLLALVGCGADPCVDIEERSLYETLIAIPSQSELIEMPCSMGDALDGPIGEWTELANQQQQGENLYAQGCNSDFPPPPSICNCYEVACEAQ